MLMPNLGSFFYPPPDPDPDLWPKNYPGSGSEKLTITDLHGPDGPADERLGAEGNHVLQGNLFAATSSQDQA